MYVALQVDKKPFSLAYRFQTTKGLSIDSIPVADAAIHASNVDKVKRVVLEGPGNVVGIVDLETAVGRDPTGLHG